MVFYWISELSCSHMLAKVDHLTKARCLVEEARRIVWEQKGRITRLRAAGCDTLDAERTLRLLEANLQIFQEHKRALELEQQGAFPEARQRGWPNWPPRLIAAE
jgi:hypothetical protein